MRKKFIGFLIVIILMIIGSMAMRLANESTEDTESIENVENTERADEEYISIFLDNREDFEYVAEIMQKWDFGSIYFERKGVTYGDSKTGKGVGVQKWDLGRIYFKKEDMINGNSEIAEEITTNEEFYIHLKNLYNLGEVSAVARQDGEIEFSFARPPKDYHGGWYYWENTDEGGLMKTAVIDENWTLEMLPNV